MEPHDGARSRRADLHQVTELVGDPQAAAADLTGGASGVALIVIAGGVSGGAERGPDDAPGVPIAGSVRRQMRPYQRSTR